LYIRNTKAFTKNPIPDANKTDFLELGSFAQHKKHNPIIGQRIETTVAKMKVGI
jgi:hypothetical protein